MKTARASSLAMPRIDRPAARSFTLYHAGDTCVFGDMKIIGELYKPDLVCLPIGDHFTMDLAKQPMRFACSESIHVLPIHYGTFPALTGTPDALRELTQDIAGLEIHASSRENPSGNRNGPLRDSNIQKRGTDL